MRLAFGVICLKVNWGSAAENPGIDRNYLEIPYGRGTRREPRSSMGEMMEPRLL